MGKKSRRIKKADRFLFEEPDDDSDDEALRHVDIGKMKALFQRGKLDLSDDGDYETILRIYRRDRDFLNL